MDDTRLGRLVRALRQRRGWRQADLARRAGVGRTVVVDIEAGRIDGMRVRTIRKVASTFGLSSEMAVRGLGADADRVLDEGHAGLLGACSRWLTNLGWRTAAEVSYSEWGERGSIDLLAWHAPTSTLLVVEVKTELVSVEATLRKHDEKVRLARTVAEARFAWQAKSIGRLLVLSSDQTERRRVAAHASVLDGAYPLRSYAVRRWCQAPHGPIEGLIFLSNVVDRRRDAMRGRRERIRVPRKVPAEHECPS